MMFQEDPKFVVILSTAPDLDTARGIARALVERRLAACVNLVPAIESIYRWEGKVETGAEVLMILKTEARLQAEALAALTELHPYRVPEGIALTVTGGLEKYLAWISESVRPDCDSLG